MQEYNPEEGIESIPDIELEPKEEKKPKKKTTKKTTEKIDKDEVKKVIDDLERHFSGVKRAVFDTFRKRLGIRK